MTERFLNALWVAIGLATCVHAWRNLGLMGPNGPELGFFPLLAGVMVGVGGLVLLARPHATLARDIAWPRGAGLVRVVTVIGGLVLMTVLTRYIGFLAAAVLTMVMLLRAIERTGWAQVIVLALASSGAVWWLFGRALAVPLPRGPWGF